MTMEDGIKAIESLVGCVDLASRCWCWPCDLQLQGSELLSMARTIDFCMRSIR